jgi:hypothetical protein
MSQLLRVRSVVLGLIEKARRSKYVFPLDLCKFLLLLITILRKRQLKSSLEAEVDLILPSDDGEASHVWELLQREGMPSFSNIEGIG